MRHLMRGLLSVLVVLATLGAPAVGRAQTTADQFTSLATRIDAALADIAEGDVAAARTEYQVFNDGWRDLRFGIRARSQTSAQSIEDAMADVTAALGSEPVDAAAAQAALQTLRAQADGLIALGPGSPQTLTVYSAQHDYTTKALVAAFQQRTGITVRVHFGDDEQLANQLVVEGSATPADVFLTENSLPLMLLSQQGLLARVDPFTLSKVPARFNSPDQDWVGIAARETALIYNPQVISDTQLPNSLLDLGQPAWKGKLALAPAEADFQPVVTAVIKLNGSGVAERWLTGFKQNAAIYNDNEGIVSAVEKGQVGAAIVNHYYWFRAAAEAGGPSAMHSRLHYFGGGDPGALLNVSGAGPLRASPQPELAQAFLEFLVSEQGERALVASGDFEYPLGSGVAASTDVKPLDQLQPPSLSLGDLGDGKDALELLQKVGLL
jgi:iron(III) transport system substrate-binding protein